MAVLARSSARARHNASTPAPAVTGSRYAMTFDETNDQVTGGVTSITVTEPIVFAALFRRSSDKNGAIVGLSTASGGARWMQVQASTDASSLSLIYNDQTNGGWGTGTPAVALNGWYLGVAQKRNTSPGRIDASILNCATGVWTHASNVANVAAGATTPTTFIIGAVHPLQGNGSGTARFGGQVAIAALGNTALEIADIESLWSGTVSRLTAWKALPWKRLVPLNRSSASDPVTDLITGATLTVTETSVYDDPALGVPLNLSANRPAPGQPVQTGHATGSVTFSMPAKPTSMNNTDLWQVYANDQAVQLALPNNTTSYTLNAGTAATLLWNGSWHGASTIYASGWDTGQQQWDPARTPTLNTTDVPSFTGQNKSLDVKLNVGDFGPASTASTHRTEMVASGAAASITAGNTYAFRFQVKLAGGFLTAPSFRDICQWKNSGTGSPPLELAAGDHWSLQGGFNGGDNPDPADLRTLWNGGAFTRLVWHDFVLQIKFATGGSGGTGYNGWVSLWHAEGRAVNLSTDQLLNQYPHRTMYTGTTTYVKAGEYRSSSATENDNVLHAGWVMGATVNDVMNAYSSALPDGVPVNVRVGYGTAGNYSDWSTPAVAMTPGP